MVWIGAVVAALVFLDLLFVELRRAFREAKRIVHRLEGYADLPIFSQMATGERDLERIAAAMDAKAALLARAHKALAALHLTSG